MFAGMSADALRGTRTGDFLVAPDARIAERGLRSVLETGRPLIFIEQPCRLLTDPPGRERFVAVSAFRMQDPAGEVLGVTQFVEDVTERERARRRLALLNDASGRIGTTLDVVRTAQELARVAVPGLADCVAVDLLEPVVQGGEPGPAGSARLHRAALSCVSERPPPAAQRPDGEVVFAPDPVQERCLRQRLPVLETGTVAGAGGAGAEADAHSALTVPLTARGAVLGW